MLDLIDAVKACSACGESKPFDEFNKAARGSGGRSAWCRDCSKEYNRRYNAANQTKRVEYQQQYREQNREKVREAGRRYRSANASKIAEIGRLSRYGITPDTYSDLLKRQNGVCAICRRPPADGRSLHVDHDHACCPGRKSCGACVMGLLCHSCNVSLGLMGDDPERITALAEYASGRRESE